MNRPRTAGLPLLLLACLLLPACANLPQVGVVPVTGLDTPIPEGTAPALDIHNHRGSVTVVVDPKALGPDVRAVPRSGHPIEQEVRWTAASMSLDSGLPVLRILSTPQDTGAPDTPVDITVTLPAVGGVRVRNEDGLVTLRDVRGAIEVHSSLPFNDGPAIFIQTRHAITAPMLLISQAGGIEVRMGRGSAGQIVASAEQGTVTVDAARAETKNVRVEKGVYTATLNDGEHEHRISTQAGNVTVLVGKGFQP